MLIGRSVSRKSAGIRVGSSNRAEGPLRHFGRAWVYSEVEGASPSLPIKIKPLNPAALAVGSKMKTVLRCDSC